MPVNWTIAGETGKAFNATARSLSTAAIDSARLDFKSLEPDTLTFTITPQSLTSATIPELRQEMILYRDGVQYFVGHVTDVRTMINSGMQQSQITVSGPWWWLEKIPFTSVIADGTGVSQERISYVFGTASAGQNLKTSIEAAINRAAALGAPIATIAQGSSVDAMFTVPRITLNQSTCGQVISELVRICPDTMAWFDYSTKPVRIRVGRRGVVSATSLDVNTSPITSIDINPVIDLEVSQVVLPYVDRNTQGRTRFQVQTAGTNVATKRQIITVSGPELDTFLPNDLFDSQTISVTTNFASHAYTLDASLKQVATRYGFASLPVSAILTYYLLYDRRASTISGSEPNATASNWFVGGNNLSNKSGTILTGYKIITSSDPLNWVGINVVDATLYGQFFYYHVFDSFGSRTTNPYPAWATEAGFVRVATGFEGTSYYANNITLATKPFSFNVKATNSISGTSQTFYRPADYSFIAPPADLAANLLAAQNWIPYEGSIQLEQEDVGGVRYRGTKVNISNSLPAFSTMGALVSGESLEIETGRTTVNLGAPARNDYRTLVDKIRKTSQDNIVYI